MAGWSQDATMIREINSGKDLHGFVASMIFGVPYDGKKTKYREEFGKRMNLGIMYGQTEYGLAAKTGISVERARELLVEYDILFPGVREWLDSKHQEAVRLGYVTDLFGARRHLPAAMSADEWELKRALRQAGNFPIQSTANRFTLFSLCVAHRMVDDAGLEEKIVLCGTVHDSIIADAAPGYEAKAAEILEAALTWHNDQPHWAGRGVRMEAEIKIGPNLKDTEPFVLQRAA
jgi:DNA polymerase-1